MMNRTALIVSLAAVLTLAGCNNQSDEEQAAASDTEESGEVEAADGTPKTDAEGNEIVSEGPNDDATPYGSGGGSGVGSGGNDNSGSNSAGNGASTAPTPVSRPAPRSTGSANSARNGPAASPKATPPKATPPAGSKLQKADPQ